MNFRYTILYVEDVARALSFYEEAFGFARGFLHETGVYGELNTGETKLAFSARALMESLGKAPAQANAARPVFEIAFETDDVEGAFAKVLEAGAASVQPPRREDWGQVTSYVADPDGYLVEICSPVSPPG